MRTEGGPGLTIGGVVAGALVDMVTVCLGVFWVSTCGAFYPPQLAN
jgi:hypothetical protein